MKLGGDRKRLAMLGGLVVIGGYLFYSNVVSDSPAPRETPRPTGALSHTSPAPPEAPGVPPKRPIQTGRASEDFRPRMPNQKSGKPEDRIDPMSIDPTLRTDLLTKVQGVELAGGSRNLFQFGAAPPPPLPKGDDIVKVKDPASEPPKPMGPPAPPPPPPPPPILLKYYGYSSAKGDARKHAFFLDGDEILVAAEGEMVKKRYKVVRIGVNSVVMEDTQFKHEQTLPLAEEAAG